MLSFCISLEEFEEVDKILESSKIEYWADFDQGGSRMVDYIVKSDILPVEIRKILHNQICKYLDEEGNCIKKGSGGAIRFQGKIPSLFTYSSPEGD